MSMTIELISTVGKPPLPSYTLHTAPPLLPFVSDNVLSLASVPLAYLTLSIFWEAIDASGIWEKYRIHPSKDVLKRNRVSKAECIRGVLLYHVASLAAAIAVSWGQDGNTYRGKEEYDIAVWATRLQLAESYVPSPFGLVSLVGKSSSVLTGLLREGFYQTSVNNTSEGVEGITAFGTGEYAFASLLYWVLIPVFQFWICFFIADTWFYWGHRAFHTSKYLYSIEPQINCSSLKAYFAPGNFHSVHHKLYVIYAFGAVYASPVEGIAVDFIAFNIGIMISGLSPRQAMFFNFIVTWKAMSDHCGYVLPWDPFIYLTENTSQYHDIHHQTWGLKNNYGIYFTFWDRLMGTSKEVEPLKQTEKSAEKIDSRKDK